MQLSFLRRKFRPRLSVTVITVAVCVVLLKLGFWQLDRAGQKRQLIDRYQQSLHAEPLRLSVVAADTAGLNYFPVQFRGFYDNGHSILLENRRFDGRLGYEVVTPMQLTGDKRVLLVNRGWLPAGKHRQELPKINPELREQNVRGFVRMASRNPFSLQGTINPATVTWPLTVQELDFASLAKVFKQQLYHFSVLLAEGEPGGFARHWQPVLGKPSKHVGYAVQWFALAAVLALLYLIVSMKGDSSEDTARRSNSETDA